MDPIAKRVAVRFAAVVPFRPKPSGPTLTIAGKKYVLSNYWAFAESIVGEPTEGGAKLIDVGGPRFSYLWALNQDKKQVGMWRISDGDEKAFGSVNQHSSDIITLDRKKQLNRVTNEEFRAIERWMRDKQDDTLQAMKKYLEEQADEWDKLSKKLVQELFDTKVLPGIQARWKDIDQGAAPLGFKLNERNPRPPVEQAKLWVADQIMAKGFSLEVVEAYIKSKGFDPDNPPNQGDFQALDWARNDIRDEFYDTYFRSL